MNEVKEKIRTFIVNNFLLGVNVGNLNDSDSFLEKGIIKKIENNRSNYKLRNL